MMAAKPAAKHWTDLKALTAALAVTIALGLWNLFATLDNPTITEKSVGTLPPLTTEAASPAQPPAFSGKIILGGQPPAPQITIVQGSRSQNSRQPAPITRTRSS